MHDIDDGGDTDRLDRRGFLGLVAFGLTGIVSIAGGIVALVYAAAPALRGAKGAEADAAWSAVPDAKMGSAAAGPSRHTVPVVSDAGWAKTQSTYAIFIDEDANKKPVAFSARCPHEGCQVDWEAAASRYHCACHQSSWTREGERIAGPTKRGLDPIEVRSSAAGEVEVKYVTYALDSAERIKVG